MIVTSITTTIGFKIWPVHHQNSGFTIRFFPICNLSQGDEFPATSHLPCRRLLFCSAICRLIAIIIKWPLQWPEKQEAWGRREYKAVKIANECVDFVQKRTSLLLRHNRHWLDHSTPLCVFFAQIFYLLLKSFLGGILGILGSTTFHFTEKVY